MDSFNLPKKRRATSIDGFVHSTKRGRQNPGDLQAFNRYYGSKKPSTDVDPSTLPSFRLDDFTGPEGFLATTQTPITKPDGGDGSDELSNIKGEEVNMPKTAEIKTKRRLFKKKSKSAKVKKPRSKHHKFKLGLKIAGGLAGLVLLVAGGLTLKAYLTARHIFKGGSNGAAALDKNVDPTLLKGEGDGRVNILVLGKGGPGHDGPDLTDTLLIASLDPVAKEAALLSIPRDFWVKSSASGYQSKINEVYANAKYAVLNSYTLKQQTDEIKEKAENAGLKAIEDTISSVVGIPIHYYTMVDFEAFRQSIDAVGGVDVNVKTQLYDASVAWENNYNPVIADVGLQHFDGKRALLYSRSRMGSVRGDFERTERQREIITALKSKVLSVGTFANPLKLNQLLNAFGDHVSTDFSIEELMRVYDLSKGIAEGKIMSFGLDEYVHSCTNCKGSAQIPKAGMFDYSVIQNYVRNVLRDSFLKSEDASVIILNGTSTAGLATLKSTELKSFGYNVTQVGDAPTKNYSKTVLIDLTKGVKRYTKNYLEKRLGISAITTLPDATINAGTANFVIILGSNEPGATQ